MASSNYEEIRRVRHEMSKKCGHDTRKLIAMINEYAKDYPNQIISPGTVAEQCDLPKSPTVDIPTPPSTIPTS